ncbi:hypothetical protein DBV15_00369 [Temnothorax longispinosus]|uniref:C2H2-type domain-containing protein n=1 Tax=Temnothorax longispinosus TaxID=300112 RepID=A0A4S2L0T6_9HYME|nr:hypothetical protein DBV15_00369 [Temnothorax longispinosus]
MRDRERTSSKGGLAAVPSTQRARESVYEERTKKRAGANDRGSGINEEKRVLSHAARVNLMKNIRGQARRRQEGLGAKESERDREIERKRENEKRGRKREKGRDRQKTHHLVAKDRFPEGESALLLSLSSRLSKDGTIRSASCSIAVEKTDSPGAGASQPRLRRMPPICARWGRFSVAPKGVVEAWLEKAERVYAQLINSATMVCLPAGVPAFKSRRAARSARAESVRENGTASNLRSAWFGGGVTGTSYPCLQDTFSPPDTVVRVGNEGEHQFVAHKGVLAAHSGYLKALLASAATTTATTSSTNSPFDPACATVAVTATNEQSQRPVTSVRASNRNRGSNDSNDNENTAVISEHDRARSSRRRARVSGAKEASSTSTVFSVVYDIACCDGPVRFHRVLNENYSATSHGPHGAPTRPPRSCQLPEGEDPSSENDENGGPATRGADHARSPNNDSSNDGSNNSNNGGCYTCDYCKHTFKSQYCYRKHAKRHLLPTRINEATGSSDDGGGGGRESVNHGSRQDAARGNRREVRLLDLNVQYYPCKICGCKFPSYYFVHKHRKLCHANDEERQSTTDGANASSRDADASSTQDAS